MSSPLRLLLGARGLRDFGDGFVAVLLPVYLKALGFSPLEVGALAGTALFGSALLTLAVGFLGVRYDHRLLLISSAGLMTAVFPIGLWIVFLACDLIRLAGASADAVAFFSMIGASSAPSARRYQAPKPSPKRGEALVRVMAAGVTPTELSWSSAYATRDGADRLPAIPGHEFSGIVEAAGADAIDVEAGQAVYALTDFWRDGSDAEYIVIAASDLAPKPRTLDFNQAAAIPLSALTAWQGLFDHGMLAPGQKVLIHGAAGGVGSFAVQLANWRGAHVSGTASAANLPFLRTIGARDTIDYKAVRFEDVVHDADVVLDTVGGDTLERSWPVVRRGGVIVTTAGEISEAQTVKYGVRGVSFIVTPSRQELVKIKELIDGGIIRPIVSAVFPLAQARQAFERGIGGHTRGKLVLSVQPG